MPCTLLLPLSSPDRPRNSSRTGDSERYRGGRWGGVLGLATIGGRGVGPVSDLGALSRPLDESRSAKSLNSRSRPSILLSVALAFSIGFDVLGGA